MVVAEVEGRIAGFLQLLCPDDKLIIDLIAVDQGQRRKNIASDMIAYGQKNSHSAGVIRVGTQVVNYPSLSLYEKLGFRVAGAAYVFHYHN
jgi:ribosomal protein S18 acetylase RimI-like enzyme